MPARTQQERAAAILRREQDDITRALWKLAGLIEGRPAWPDPQHVEPSREN